MPSLATFYGPEQFTRGRGAPQMFTRNISTARYIAPFVLHVQSGDASGANAVSSASVTLDGDTLLAPSAFNARGGSWAIPVTVGPTAQLSISLASAPGAHLDVWLEGQRAGTVFCEDGRFGSHSTLQAAIAATPDGGTVLVCDGTHSVQDVNISRPITIESEGPGIATLDAGSANGAIWIGGGPVPLSGTVTLNHLRFVGGQWGNVSVTQNAGNVLVSHCVFDNLMKPIGEPGPWLSALFLTGAGNSTLTVDQSTFVGGDAGVHMYGPSGTIVISGNSFRGQANSSIHIAGPTPGPITVQANTFSDCGPQWCLFTQQALSVLGNTFTIDIARRTHSPLRLDVGVGGSETALVTDNVVVGTGSGGATRADLSEYPMQVGIQVYGAADVRRNRITNAYDGIWLSSAIVTGSDNTISHTFAAIDGFGTITMTRNDLLDYVNWRTLGGSGANLKCNWWGSASGPAGISLSDIAYLPFATQPIANLPSVPCTP